MSSLYKQAILSYLGSRSYEADRVLDVGGGETKASKYTKIDCKKYSVLDNLPDLKPDYVHDLNEFKHPEEIFQIERIPSFDLIFCLNVFEYIWNPYNAVANLYAWLDKGGRLVVNFPFIYPYHNPVGIDYLRYTDEWVKKMFGDRLNFKTINIETINATDGAVSLHDFYAQEKMHHRKDNSINKIGCILEAVK